MQSKISLVYQNLGVEPQSFLDQYLGDDGFFKLSDLQSVWNILDVSYRNPNEEEDARVTLCSLKQRNRNFGAYLAEFQKYRNISGITDEGTLISFMRAGVSKEMRTQISLQQDVTSRYSYDKFVELCKECQLRLDLDRNPSQPSPFASQSRTQPNYSSRFTTQPNQPPRYPAQTTHFRPHATSTTPATGPNLISVEPEPMILDRTTISHLGPDGKLTQAERIRRYEQELCMRCGKSGHQAVNCRPRGIRVQELNLEENVMYQNDKPENA